MALKYEDLTEVISVSIFETHNEVGVGLDEETYHQFLVGSSAEGHFCYFKEIKAISGR